MVEVVGAGSVVDVVLGAGSVVDVVLVVLGAGGGGTGVAGSVVAGGSQSGVASGAASTTGSSRATPLTRPWTCWGSLGGAGTENTSPGWIRSGSPGGASASRFVSTRACQWPTTSAALGSRPQASAIWPSARSQKLSPGCTVTSAAASGAPARVCTAGVPPVCVDPGMTRVHPAWMASSSSTH